MNGDNEASSVPWEHFQKWLHSIAVVTFDLELGQALEIIYPGDADLSSIEKANICYLAFPDSNFGSAQDVPYHFRIRRTSPKIGPHHMLVLENSSVSLPLDASYLYGFVQFRQHKDPSIKRGYYQKSVVLLTPFPFFSLWNCVAAKIASGYFELGEAAIEAACHDLDQWPTPVPGTPLMLPLMGTVIQCRIPLRGDLPITGPSSYTKDDQTGPSIVLPSVSEVDIYRSLSKVLVHVQLMWELVLLGEPLLVVAQTPTRCSSMVQSLVSLICPLRLLSDFRPYFTIHDSEFREYSARARNLPAVILGVTNPFFIKALPHWPHILKVEEDRASEGPEKQTEKNKHWDGKSLDAKPGLYTQYKPFLGRDKALIKKLLKGTRPDEVCSALLRRHFLELTQSFMIPLERHLSSLMPLRKTMSPFKSIPHPRPFVLDDFLVTLEAAGPSLTCGIKGDWSGLYRRFVSTRTFAGWLSQRNSDIAKQIKMAYIEELCQADLGASVLASRHHAEIVDLVLRMRLIAVQLPTRHERRVGVIRQIAAVISRVDEELRGVLMSNCALRELLDNSREIVHSI
ncbi:unnamed protein product, partial [Mesorhabditis spiculigera]